VARRETLILRTSRITIKNWVNRSKIVQRKQRKILLLLLFRMTSENDLVLVASEQLQQHYEKCVLDLGFSYCMCPHRLWFVTYEKKTGGNILMDNDAPCKSVGIGFAQIRMHDGVVRNLIEVHHVPELKKNLVFVDVRDLKGFSYWVEGGVMQGTNQENSYILRGSTVTCSVSIVSQFENHSMTHLIILCDIYV